MSSKKTILLVLGGGKPQKFETTASTWGGFTSSIDIDLPTPYAATIGETMGQLIDESLLPVKVINSKGAEVNQFHVFITPKRSKSGQRLVDNMTYKELKSAIKGIRLTNESASAFFGNYTHMGTDALRDILDKWYSKDTKKKVKKIKVKKVLKEEKIIKKVKETKDNIVTITSNSDVIKILKEITDFLENNANEGETITFSVNKVSIADYDRIKKLTE